MNNKIKELKKQMLKVCYESKHGHLASSFSSLDILYILYNKILNINLSNYELPDSNKFIMSKGHCSLALYAVLVDTGFFNKSEMDSFCKYDGLSGHINKDTQGVTASTGSLGNGIGMAVGIALSKKIQNNKGNVYVLIGDQESLEGTTFEALSIASHFNLNNFYLIIDHNDSSPIDLKGIENKIMHFGFHIESICGHNHFDLENSLLIKKDKPVCVIAHTTKGMGIKRMELDSNAWHHRSPSDQEYVEMEKELDA